MNAIISLLSSAITRGAPLLLGTTGEILNEKSGSLNLGVEGIMAVGAIGGFLGACWTESIILGILFGFICGALCGLLFAFLTITMKANQNVTGLAMTIFGVGVCRFIGQNMKTEGTFPIMNPNLTSKFAENGIPLLKNIPIIGPLLFSHNILVYLAIIIAVCVWIYMNKTKAGLKMRAIGENPAAADSVGINVDLYKYINITLGGGIMGIGGLYMGVIINNGTWNDDWIGGYGWIAVALVIFANWSAVKALLGSFIFGLMLALQSKVGNLAAEFPNALGWTAKIPVEFYMALPFILTAVVLIINSAMHKKSGNAPSAMGINYYREDR